MALSLKQVLTLFWAQITAQFVKQQSGKGLSTNDFTMEEKNKLASLENTTIDTTLTISNAAADAKTVGDALAEKQPKGNYALKSEIPSMEGLATEVYVNTKVADLVDSAPEALDTLNELAAALGDDPNFATTLATQIGEIRAALTINYDNLVFDTTEIVFDQNTFVILDQAMLGQTVLA